MKNKFKKKIFCFIIGAIMISITTVYAAAEIYSSNISIDTTNISELSSGATLDIAITGLYDRLNSTECPNGYKCYKTFPLKIGDYVKMTPTASSYSVETSYSGYTRTQYIHPQKLNLWRVIDIKDNGTVDMVSQYVYDSIDLQDDTAYDKSVFLFKEIARSFENSNYTISSRIVGYNGQTLEVSFASNDINWYYSTKDNSDEAAGGGDVLYTKDINLINNALGTLVATTSSGTAQDYWLSSRYHYYMGSTYYTHPVSYKIRCIDDEGQLSEKSVAAYNYSAGTTTSYLNSAYIRPIVTLKANITNFTGSGTSSDPWVLP